MEETLDEFEHSDEQETGESTDDMSFNMPTGHTRFYHRCFKVNLCLNISMLITFVGLIAFGPWYTMSYSSDAVSLYAEFSLLLLYTTVTDETTGEDTFNRYWALNWPELCDDCAAETVPD
jgi:hypothetical protein